MILEVLLYNLFNSQYSLSRISSRFLPMQFVPIVEELLVLPLPFENVLKQRGYDIPARLKRWKLDSVAWTVIDILEPSDCKITDQNCIQCSNCVVLPISSTAVINAGLSTLMKSSVPNWSFTALSPHIATFMKLCTFLPLFYTPDCKSCSGLFTKVKHLVLFWMKLHSSSPIQLTKIPL